MAYFNEFVDLALFVGGLVCGLLLRDYWLVRAKVERDGSDLH